jgi:hypothetical protein
VNGCQIEYKRAVKWSAIRKVFQLVFQPKVKTNINYKNQYDKSQVQITPAHQSENDKARQVRALSHLGFGKLRPPRPPPVGARLTREEANQTSTNHPRSKRQPSPRSPGDAMRQALLSSTFSHASPPSNATTNPESQEFLNDFDQARLF